MCDTNTAIKTEFENEFDTICNLCPISLTRKLLRLDSNHEAKMKSFHKLLSKPCNPI